MQKWCENIQLKINPKQTVIYVDKRFDWIEHIDKIMKKAGNSLYVGMLENYWEINPTMSY